jgi:hypothetical protein
MPDTQTRTDVVQKVHPIPPRTAANNASRQPIVQVMPLWERGWRS